MRQLLIIGAVQYGLMYSFLNMSFQYLLGWQVAFLTIITPLYIILLEDFHQRRIDYRGILLALLAVLGAGLLLYQAADWREHLLGFLLMQGSNLCFAYGQVAYRRLRPAITVEKDAHFFAVLFIGAALASAMTTTATSGWGDLQDIRLSQTYALLYLGLISSGLCFFAWNVGATRVGAAQLSVANNLKIPCALLFSVLVFGEEADWLRLALGGGLIVAALRLAQKR